MQNQKYYLSRWACFAVTVPRMSTMSRKKTLSFAGSQPISIRNTARKHSITDCLRQKQNGYNELAVFKLRSIALMDQRVFFFGISCEDVSFFSAFYPLDPSAIISLKRYQIN